MLRTTALNFARHEAISMMLFFSCGRVGVGGRRSSVRLLTVVHALHAHEHHRQTWQKKEQRRQFDDSEPVLAQPNGDAYHGHTGKNQTAPAGKPITRALTAAVTG